MHFCIVHNVHLIIIDSKFHNWVISFRPTDSKKKSHTFLDVIPDQKMFVFRHTKLKIHRKDDIICCFVRFCCCCCFCLWIFRIYTFISGRLSNTAQNVHRRRNVTKMTMIMCLVFAHSKTYTVVCVFSFSIYRIRRTFAFYSWLSSSLRSHTTLRSLTPARKRSKWKQDKMWAHDRKEPISFLCSRFTQWEKK